MRVAVTLDKDLHDRLHKLRKERGISFKAIVNEAMRIGFAKAGVLDEGRRPALKASRSSVEK
jgi:hypothetical protein